MTMKQKLSKARLIINSENVAPPLVPEPLQQLYLS